MKHLYLLRHTQSAEKTQGQPDKNRTLTPTGMRQVTAVALYMIEKKLGVDCILSSAAIRAQMTAELLAERISFPHDSIILDDELFEASVGTFLQVIRRADNHNHLMVVGHNPTISYFTEYISGAALSEITPGSLITLQTSIQSWAELGQGKADVIDIFSPE